MTWLAFFLISAHATDSASCAVALSDGIKFPFTVAAFAAPALVADIENALVGRDAHQDAFELVEARVKPVMQNVAWFLNSRDNYPAAFDSNELAAQADAVHDEMYARVQALKTRRRPVEPRSRWSSWFSAPAAEPDADQVVTEIRVLHFTLNALDADLEKRGRAARSLARVTGELLGLALETHAALGDLLGTLERTTTPETARRVATLHQDLGLQIHLIQAIDANLEQRSRAEELTRERIRRLTQVLLPMEVVMAGATLDLSPLAPADVRPVAEAPEIAGSPSRLPMPVDTLIALAKKSMFPSETNETLMAYFKTTIGLLTADDLSKLLAALRDHNPDSYRGSMLTHFVAARSSGLSVHTIIVVSRWGVTSERRDQLLVDYVQRERTRLSPAEMIEISQEFANTTFRRWHLAQMGIK